MHVLLSHFVGTTDIALLISFSIKKVCYLEIMSVERRRLRLKVIRSLFCFTIESQLYWKTKILSFPLYSCALNWSRSLIYFFHCVVLSPLGEYFRILFIWKNFEFLRQVHQQHMFEGEKVLRHIFIKDPALYLLEITFSTFK